MDEMTMKLIRKSSDYAHLIGQMMGFMAFLECRYCLSQDQGKEIKEVVDKFKVRFDEINRSIVG